MSKHDKFEHHKSGQEKPEPGLTKPLYNNVGGELNDAPSADQVREHSPRGTAEAESRAGEGPVERASGALEPMQNVGERLSTHIDTSRGIGKATGKRSPNGYHFHALRPSSIAARLPIARGAVRCLE